MKLIEIFDSLSYGELSQLSIGNAESTGIKEEDQPKVITHINLGLLELHKRFDLKRGSLILQMYEQIMNYELRPDFAVSNLESLEPIKYIVDTPLEPFQDDVLKIERIFAESGGEYILNNENEYNSLHTPTPLTLQIPLPQAENVVEVEYRATHPRIPVRGVNPLTYEVDLPYPYLEALIYYVASRMFAPLNDPQAPSQESQMYMLKFEAAIAKLTELAITPVMQNTKENFKRNGWV